MPSPGMRGWYVELDEKLVEAFEKLFPEHGKKSELTTAAVVWAVRMRATGIAAVMSANETAFGKQTFSVHFPQEGTNVSRNTGRTESPDSGVEGGHTDHEGTSE